ncbi:sugar phosphate isomerase/epimerase [Paenibacillus doosanensis]|uniref:Fructoselysine 3-epimerase n=1 Tax=Paenibacillus konkukensis TaxID=2020716 RepID=A0ABY4RTV3_9BACL|nr:MULTISPECIES: sugar phosphate isomerase/epimerase [Paenibacillus]MCS7464216.1 sugar phosphate isomerase/epimerase [Paenibacillus doosanensis]UQZ85593.1 fructoselysine 3-epimerase [Paenibacillus konkukensis]
MNISTSLNGFGTDFERAIPACKAAGFEALDFNYWDHQKDVMAKTAEEEEAWAHRIRDLADRNGLPFTQMHGPVHGGLFHDMVLGLTPETFLQLAERSIRTASILGIPWVVFHGSGISGTESYREVTEYNVQFFRRLFPVMERTGVGIALENFYDRAPRPHAARRKYCAALDELVELVDALDHPLVGACLDTGHAHEQGIHPSEYVQLGKRLKATHINDNDGLSDQHLLPFQGSIDWTAAMKALRKMEYEGDLTYETHRPIVVLPQALREEGLRYAAAVGKYLIGLREEQTEA